MNLITRTFKNLTDILQGKREFVDISKYRFICYSIAFIHVFITIRFYSVGYTILYIYNLASILFYLYIGTFLTRQGKFYTIYLCTFFEILLHSTLATLLAGWGWGYMIYVLALMPVSFYLAYSLPQFGRSLSKPFLFNFVAICIFILTRIMCDYIDPIYTNHKYDPNLTVAYNLNALVSCTMLILFSLLFIIEIRRNEIRLESQNSMLEAVSSKDPLTGLLNRRSMNKHLNAAFELAKTKGKLFTVIIADIDDFKKVNDTYGHNVGDDVLINVSNIITSNIPPDAHVCRWGGEEILILIPNTIETAIPVAEKIRESISESITRAEETAIHITMTFGIAEYIPGFSMTKLISMADDNLYKGKKDGKNRVVA
jgi:diguanylate cyclase (GGDEF)-like protein